jgi:hypothetical protein
MFWPSIQMKGDHRMLQQTQERAVETGGITQSNAFTIKANAKAFKVLIDGLYSDKVKSIVRELWTNAYDSHIMAGTPDKPFTCILPTRFEPVFSVRDYGVSLSHNSVMGLYTTVFESTKDETNDQVGQLGLGSKSPFAYTDTFSVTSYLDGVKRMYSAYIDASGVPTIALLGEDTTDEPNGLEVGFPTKEEDISAFIRAASSVVLGFDVAPEFKGQVIDATPPERGIEGTGWYIAKNPDDLPHSGAFARQGCVLYPLSRTVFMFEDSIYYEMLDCPIVIDFEIGQLDISASRESLSYDDRTKKNIEKRLSEIKPEMLAVVEEKKKDLKTLFDFKNFSKVFFEEAAYLPPAVKEEVDRNLTYKGAKVNTIWPTLFSGRTRPEKFKPKAWEGDFHHSCISSTMTHRTKGLYFKTSHRTRLDLDSDLLVILRDPDEKVKHEPKKIRKLYDDFISKRENDLITAPKPSSFYRSNPVLMVDVKPNSYQYRKLMTLLGRPRPDQMNIVWAHDLPEPEGVGKKSYTRSAVNLKKITFGDCLQDHDFDLDKVDYYFNLYRDDVCWTPDSSSYRSLGALTEALSAAKSLGIIEDDVVIAGIPKSRKSVINQMENARNIFDVFDEYFKENPLDHSTIVGHYFNKTCAESFGLKVDQWVSKHYSPLSEQQKAFPRKRDFDEFHISDLVEGSPMRDWIEAIEECAENIVSDEFKKRAKLLRVYSLISPIPMHRYVTEAMELKATQKDLFNKMVEDRYPFLKYIINGVNYADKMPVIDYINSVDTAPEICK